MVNRNTAIQYFHKLRELIVENLEADAPDLMAGEIEQAKRHLRRYNGMPKHHFHFNLKECEWRFNYQSTANLLKVLLQWVKM